MSFVEPPQLVFDQLQSVCYTLYGIIVLYDFISLYGITKYTESHRGIRDFLYMASVSMVFIVKSYREQTKTWSYTEEVAVKSYRICDWLKQYSEIKTYRVLMAC